VIRGARLSLLIGAMASVPCTATAQLGELQIGVLGSYGTSAAYGPGAGLVLGVATGRLAYVGLRWTYHTGATTSGITNRVQGFAVDLGIVIPVHKLDVMPGVGLGVARFAQRAAGSWVHKTEFLATPGLAVEIHAGPVALIPEVQYSLAGDPEFAQPIRHRGLVASLRLVILMEVRRIRR
jgi:hypothetical protein